jgi:endonuclease/exonuclease/phosphatase family metal-dependent hydrolase
MRIMTLNVNLYETKHGEWSVRKRLIANAIRTRRPQIVALQAVRRDPARENGLDQAEQLANLLRQYVQVVFRPAVEYGNGTEDGSAFLSHLPFATVEHHSLSLGSDQSRAEDATPRLILHARLADPPLHLFNGHYSWVPAQALGNVQETLTLMNRVSGPRLLLGDLNNPPQEEPMKRLAEQGWIDAWARLRPREDGFTFESDKPSKRIDYAWASPELEHALESIELVTEEDNSERARLSDHLGLVVTLREPF